MPPHCDTHDGPVAMAGMNALETGNINCVLIWVPGTSGDELRTAFARALAARNTSPPARHVADDWFLENANPLH